MQIEDALALSGFRAEPLLGRVCASHHVHAIRQACMLFFCAKDRLPLRLECMLSNGALRLLLLLLLVSPPRSSLSVSLADRARRYSVAMLLFLLTTICSLHHHLLQHSTGSE